MPNIKVLLWSLIPAMMAQFLSNASFDLILSNQMEFLRGGEVPDMVMFYLVVAVAMLALILPGIVVGVWLWREEQKGKLVRVLWVVVGLLFQYLVVPVYLAYRYFTKNNLRNENPEST